MTRSGFQQPSYFGSAGRLLFTVLPALLLAGAFGYLWVKSTVPAAELTGGFPRALGPSTTLRLRWNNPHGVRRVTAILEQAGARTIAFERVEPTKRFSFAAATAPPGEAAFTISRKEVPTLTAGKATLVVEVQSNDLRGKVTRLTRELPVILEKPRVTADLQPVFFRHGGTGVVSFTVAGGWSEAGVRVGALTFPSWPVKSRPDRRVALFTVPPEASGDTMPVLFARNEIGDEATSTFPVKMTPVKFRERALAVDGGLIAKVLAELDPNSSGDPADRFARINSVMRRANDAALAAFAAKSDGKRLWDGTFAMLPRGKAEALFADHRTYTFQRQVLNREWHLGVDMASVQNAVIPAANAGRVVHAGPMGIYGNCVVIDHGLHVLSVYGHMSSFAIQLGDTVKKGQPVGKSGRTGLAGGDHLHLGILIGPAFVDPVEWTFSHWMEKTLLPALADLE